MQNPIDFSTTSSQEARERQAQDIDWESRIPPHQLPRARPRMGSLTPCYRTRNEPHLPAIHDTNEARDNNPCFNTPRLPIQPIGAVLHTPDVVRSRFRELKEPIFTRLKRLSEQVPPQFRGS